MLSDIFIIISSFILLGWAADRFITGSASIAKHLRIAPLIIGLTIVAFGTSAPEIFVSVTAALQGSPAIAIGNAVGSNIANIGLVLGLSALILPIHVKSKILRREYPILFLIMLLTWVLMIDGVLDRRDGIILLLCLLSLLIWLVWIGRKRHGVMAMNYEQELEKKTLSWVASIGWFVLGLCLLPIASYFIVQASINLATQLGISELIIGLTIVAIGTSLPEVAAAIAGVVKREYDIAVGNVLGSNMFNMLAVLALPGLLHPVTLNTEIIYRDMAVMFAFTIVLFLVAYGFRGAGKINRWEGALLLAIYIGYLTLLIRAATTS